MKLYAMVDKKSGVVEYFLASCDEDAYRIFSVMMMQSRPLYEFADDFFVELVEDLRSSRPLIVDDKYLFDGAAVRRVLESRKENDDAKA